jgi:hypothetical protein
MIIPTQQDYLAQKEYYKDQVRAAARFRLAREAMEGTEKGDRFYASALSWLGQRLVAWGLSLQGGRATAVPAPVPQPQ